MHAKDHRIRALPQYRTGPETAELDCGSKQFVHHHHRIRAIPLPGLQPRPARLHLLETPNKPVGVGCSCVSTTESAEFHCQDSGPNQLGTASTEPTEQACGSRESVRHHHRIRMNSNPDGPGTAFLGEIAPPLARLTLPHAWQTRQKALNRS